MMMTSDFLCVITLMWMRNDEILVDGTIKGLKHLARNNLVNMLNRNLFGASYCFVI